MLLLSEEKQRHCLSDLNKISDISSEDRTGTFQCNDSKIYVKKISCRSRYLQLFRLRHNIRNLLASIFRICALH